MEDPPSSPVPGWYHDPERPTGLRYWDGRAWTEHRQGPAAAAPPPPPRLAPAADRSAANTALALSIGGLLCCGVLGPVGMVLGRNERDRIDGGAGDPSARGVAQAAYVIGVIGSAILFVVVLIIVFAVANDVARS